MQNARIVHEHVESSELRDGCRQNAIDIALTGDIAAQDKWRASSLLGDRLQHLLAPTHERQPGSFPRIGQRNGTSNACPGAGDESNLVFEERHVD